MRQANMLDDATKRRAERAAKPWVERCARLGFAAKGVVYLLVGVLATQAALGRGGQTTDTQGALHTIAGRRFGAALLMLVAAGLAGYAVWRFVEAWVDPEGKGSEPSGLVTRAAYAGVGVVYLGLALSALRIVQGAAGDAGNAEAGWTARLLAQPFGRWLVGLVGVGIIGFFLVQIARAFQGKFPEQLRVGDLGGDKDEWAQRLGIVGLVARGVVFGLAGLFLIRAARQADPQQAGGLDEALQALARQSHGAVLLGVVAVGLAGYGAYMLLIARYRRSFVR